MTAVAKSSSLSPLLKSFHNIVVETQDDEVGTSYFKDLASEVI